MEARERPGLRREVDPDAPSVHFLLMMVCLCFVGVVTLLSTIVLSSVQSNYELYPDRRSPKFCGVADLKHRRGQASDSSFMASASGWKSPFSTLTETCSQPGAHSRAMFNNTATRSRKGGF